MHKHLRRQETLDWLEGLERAGARQRERVASMTAAEKLTQISRLMTSVPLFDLSRRAAGDEAVRDLWRQLRSRMANK